MNQAYVQVPNNSKQYYQRQKEPGKGLLEFVIIECPGWNMQVGTLCQTDNT